MDTAADIEDKYEARYLRRLADIEALALLESRQGRQTVDVTQAINAFRAMFAHCPLPAFLKNAQGIMLAKNPAYLEIYGKTDEGYIGRLDSAQWATEEAETFTATDARAREHGYAVGQEPIHNDVSERTELLTCPKWIWVLGDGVELEVGVVSGTLPLPRTALRQ